MAVALPRRCSIAALRLRSSPRRSFPRVAPSLHSDEECCGGATAAEWWLGACHLRRHSTCSPSGGGNDAGSASPSGGGGGRGSCSSPPDLKHFIAAAKRVDLRASSSRHADAERAPYLSKADLWGNGRKVYIETYGCQMNVNDTEIALSILKANGYEKTDDVQQADVALLMTCAIREGAENKIWSRIEHLKRLKKHRALSHDYEPMKIGIIGCMAERLKEKIVEREKSVDLICGPDAYKDLPRLLAVTGTGQAAVNVLLSHDETYADVVPVRLDRSAKSAFVSIMRGCDNMCSYCIVPFTRGRERSRPMSSILDEVRALSDGGVKEVTLLGQNVNSYRDLTAPEEIGPQPVHSPSASTSKGFNTVYKPKIGGRRFADLLDRVSEVDPEMRVRFTSPHPKDFPDEVLQLVRHRPNICKQLHMPAQSGSTAVLERMRRGYSREAYLELVDRVRHIIPDVSLSSDFISGFCGETEQDHEDTLSLLRAVRYNYVYNFMYSMREKTHAYHKLKDDVPEEVKRRRADEVTTLFRDLATEVNRSQIGQTQLVLVEGVSKRSHSEVSARNDGGTKVIVASVDVPTSSSDCSTSRAPMLPGDYVAVQITDATSQVLKGVALYHSSIRNFISGRRRFEEAAAFTTVSASGMG